MASVVLIASFPELEGVNYAWKMQSPRLTLDLVLDVVRILDVYKKGAHLNRFRTGHGHTATVTIKFGRTLRKRIALA